MSAPCGLSDDAWDNGPDPRPTDSDLWLAAERVALCDHDTMTVADCTWFGYVHVQYECPKCGALLTYSYTGERLQ